jgi:hypothetical protein
MALLPLLAALTLVVTPGPKPPANDVPLPPPPVLKPSAKDVPLPPPPVPKPTAKDVPLPPPPVLKPSARDLPPTPGSTVKAMRVAVPDTKVSGELPPRQLVLVEGALLSELRKLENLSAIGMGEIREMLSIEYQRQMLGCSADEACLAEIGGALGTDEMLASSIVVDGKTATFTLKRINMRGARVTGSDTRRLTRANGEELLGAIGPMTQAVYPDRALRPGRTRGVAKEVALRLNPPPLPRWPFFATAAAAVVAGAAGAGYAYLASDARRQYQALAQRSLTEPVAGAQLRDLQQSVSSRSSTANLLFVTAGGLAVAAGVEAFFTDWHGYRTSLDAAPGQATLKVGGTF